MYKKSSAFEVIKPENKALLKTKIFMLYDAEPYLINLLILMRSQQIYQNITFIEKFMSLTHSYSEKFPCSKCILAEDKSQANAFRCSK
jgi:hypothetical protein